MSENNVAVIIPTFNKKDLLKECLDSLKKQTFSDFSITIIDNGSFDGTAEMLKKDFPESYVIRNSNNRGFVAVNQGIKISQGDFVVLLNNDAVADKNWLKELVEGLKRHPEAGFAASKILNYHKRNIIDSAGDGFSFAMMGGYSIGKGEKDGSKYAREKYCFSATGGGSIYRKSLFNKIGLFDEKFFAFFEDIDLGFRANWAGFKCIYLPKAILYHRGGETAIHNSNFHLLLTDRNKIITVMKNLPFKFFWHYKRSTYNMLMWPFIEFRMQRMKVWPFIKNRFLLILWLPQILFQRFVILTYRKITISQMENIIK